MNLKKNEQAEEVLDNANLQGAQDLYSASNKAELKSLQKSYKALQAEFTRKCQRLAELERTVANLQHEPPGSNNNFETENTVQENLFFETEKETQKSFPVSDAEKVLEEFKAENPPPVIVANLRSAEEFISDENFVRDYVLQNKDIRYLIIADYVNSVNRNKSRGAPPKGLELSALPKKPSSFEECGAMLLLGRKNNN